VVEYPYSLAFPGFEIKVNDAELVVIVVADAVCHPSTTPTYFSTENDDIESYPLSELADSESQEIVKPKRVLEVITGAVI
jgi:hypothetical protein